MDKEFLKKYKLQEAVKRFQQINEYTFITSPVIAEEGDEEVDNVNQQQPQPQDTNPSGEQQPLQNDNGFEPNSQPDMSDNGDEQQNSEMPLDNPQPMNDNGEEDNTDEMNSDDTVIDVDDLTNSQEATEYKIDGVDDKLTRMLSVLTKFSAALEASDKKIDDLRQEFEKRNPSEQEKLNIRSQASYPYSETPKDYWDAKTANNPHYNVMYDNDVSTAKEQEKFDITNDDIKNSNLKSVADSFDLDNMKLDDFMKF